MKEEELMNVFHSTQELRKLIFESPELPVLVLAGENANIGYYGYMLCTEIRAYKGEFLDCATGICEDRIFTEREDFEDSLEDTLQGDFEGSDREFERYLEEALEEYEPYWKPAIIIYVDN